MEAKDTVIDLGETTNESLRVIMEKILLEQAKISFKAGIKEVVDWVEKNSCSHPAFSICEGSGLRIPEPPMNVIYSKDWQAKKKEWGIE